MASILVAEDEPIYSELLCFYLRASGFTVHAVSSVAEILPLLARRTFDALLLDLFLGQESSIDVLPDIVHEYSNAQIIIMSAQGTVSLAVTAMEKGASTFLTKSHDPKEIVEQVQKRLNDNQDLRSSPDELARQEVLKKKFVLKSSKSKKLWTVVKKLAAVDVNVLLQGESGSGKEVVARAIHDLSVRRSRPFIAVNCAAVPEQLLESELFGYKKGAFTDAKNDYKGIFEQAQGGSLLLDEIGDMPLGLQVKLLRVLQERSVKPLGSSQLIPVDFRLISASHHNLREDAIKKVFREDLFFRIAVVEVNVPALRERSDDIPDLITIIVDELREKYGKPLNAFSDKVLDKILHYAWPGNIRELRNVIERAYVLSEEGTLLEEDLFLEPSVDLMQNPQNIHQVNLTEARKMFERHYLKQLMELTGGNVTEMAKVSGRYRTDIYRLLSKHGLSSSDHIKDQ